MTPFDFLLFPVGLLGPIGTILFYAGIGAAGLILFTISVLEEQE